ncbi:hypothetical protein LPB137_13420 [Poseidonibacter parvus]|uniref:Uncharacterized protein n=2 Tax=Campylobacterales TaxID=213849 RepID=A0A1P8KQI1_9BACT|nr:hypothetical protein LPB137_13420 [Poseidonibacter parvus]
MYYLIYIGDKMIFIALFGFIAFVVISLNMYDNYNLQKIEDYIKKEKCESFIYTKGSYKALCQDKLLQIANSFNLDIKTQKKELVYKEIKDISIDKKSIIINKKEKVSFSKEEELNTFYRNLKQKLNK